MTELAEGLAARGHEIRVVTGMPNYPQRRIYEEYRGRLYHTEERHRVTIQRCYVWIRPKPGLVTRILLDGSFVLTSLVQALRGWTPEVILLTVPPLPVCIPAALLSWFRSCPVVLNLQDILPEAAIHLGLIRNRMMIQVFENLEKFAYRSASVISVITDGFADNLVRKGVPSEKIVCIPNWVDTHFIYPQAKNNSNLFRETYQLQDKFVVLYSGNIALTQGLETVIEAAVHLRGLTDIIFVIVGEEKALEQLQKRCCACGVNNVLLLPFQPREMLPVMLAASDVGLVMQKKNVVTFNMPSKIQVLLASGRPIIASVPFDGMAARAIQQSGGGMLVEPECPKALAQAILNLRSNSHQADLLGQQGRRYAIEHYAFESALNQYEALFHELAGHPQKVISLPNYAAKSSIVDVQGRLTLPDRSV
jgi:colanic acid biosynthesis glycosyl transferase WcaI